jgi:hypothetical protein
MSSLYVLRDDYYLENSVLMQSTLGIRTLTNLKTRIFWRSGVWKQWEIGQSFYSGKQVLTIYFSVDKHTSQEVSRQIYIHKLEVLLTHS